MMRRIAIAFGAAVIVAAAFEASGTYPPSYLLAVVAVSAYVIAGRLERHS